MFLSVVIVLPVPQPPPLIEFNLSSLEILTFVKVSLLGFLDFFSLCVMFFINSQFKLLHLFKVIEVLCLPLVLLLLMMY